MAIIGTMRILRKTMMENVDFTQLFLNRCSFVECRTRFQVIVRLSSGQLIRCYHTTPAMSIPSYNNDCKQTEID